MVTAEQLLATKVLGLSHAHAVIGISMGGDLLVWRTQESTIEYRLKQSDEENATDVAQRIGLMEITSPVQGLRDKITCGREERQ